MESKMISKHKENQVYPDTIIYVKTPRVSCSGENNDHPKVWYTVPEVGEGCVVCGYCDIKFAREPVDSWEDETVMQMQMTSRGSYQ